MKDLEARQKIQELQQQIELLPGKMAAAMMQDVQPKLNQIIAMVNAQSEGIKKIADAVNTLSDSVDVLEAEGNSLRVDLNAQREATADLGARLDETGESLRDFVSRLVVACTQPKADGVSTARRIERQRR